MARLSAERLASRRYAEQLRRRPAVRTERDENYPDDDATQQHASNRHPIRRPRGVLAGGKLRLKEAETGLGHGLGNPQDARQSDTLVFWPSPMSTSLPSTITEAADWLRRGRISSVDLTRRLLTDAQAAQETVGAFAVLTEQTALADAENADRELSSGTDKGPLLGIPIGVKDILATADAPTTASSRVLDPGWGKRGDASVVRKLRAAGAVVLGKTVLHEFAIGWPDPGTGVRYARNPCDLARSPGGSSSGTGAAIAAGFVLGGLGTDTGGSIRGPAAFCGISGLKPTFGRVSKEGCVPLSWSLDHIGPMARTARDCAAMLQVMAGHDPLDSSTAAVDVPDYLSSLNGSVEGVCIGVPPTYFFDQPELNDEIRQAVLGAVDRLVEAGAAVCNVVLPHAPIARAAQRAIMLSEAYAYHQADLASRASEYGRHTRGQLLQGALYSGADYVQAQRVRTVIKREVRQVMANVDVLIVPAGVSVASRFEGYDPDAMRRAPNFMSIWNLTGLPALCVPCGISSEGLPIGMQIVGKPFDEATVLRVGDAYQHVTDWHARTASAAKQVQPA